MKMRRLACSTACGLACMGTCLIAGGARGDITAVQKDFQSPPDDARIMVRWWWFGTAVTPEGIERELKAMKAGGIGGVEVQPTYPLVVDGTGAEGAKNLKFMSPEFLNTLGVASAKAKELGMRMDLTLGSGWPYGGPMFNQQTDGTKELTTETVNASAGQTSVRAASRTAFVAFAGSGGAAARGGNDNADLSGYKEVPFADGIAQLPAGWAGGQVVFFGTRAAGLTAVKRPAYGADGPVIDHLSAKAVDKFIQLVAEPEIKACGNNPPYSIFCDSLEVTGENWTDDLLAEFQKRRGYDLKPLLTALIGSVGPRTADIRHDFGQTVTDLFNDNFNAKFTALARKYNTRFRIQGYGSPAAALFSYSYADLPEGEAGGNANWRTFRATRFAASASHLLGQNLASSETFTWLHQAPFRATPLDMKEEVDLHFLEGINQIDCHGWGYTPNGLPYPGGSFYAAASFTDKNPWYVAMPEISGYMQRVSQMLREGTPANDIALYANDSDVWAGATTAFSSMNAAYTNQTHCLDAVLDAGYNLDLMDDGMLARRGKVEGNKLAFGDVKYSIVLLNGPENMPLATLRTLDAFAKGGGILVWVSSRPPAVHVPGYQTTDAEQQEATAIMSRLFGNGGPGLFTASMEQFKQRVTPKLAPDFLATAPAGGVSLPQIGAIHRHADGAEIYFIANTSNQQQSFQASFRQRGLEAQQWDPLTGRIHRIGTIPQIVTQQQAGNGAANDITTLQLSLDGYASTIILFTSPLQASHTIGGPSPLPALDLSTGWHVTFASGPGGSGNPVDMNQLASWTTLPGMANYSGVATYEKKLTISADLAKAPAVITFGPAAPVAARAGGQGVAAAMTAPVNDAAVVYVNDHRVGASWCPPFEVDLTGALKEGENTIRIDVGNTAVNYLAKAGFPNYNQRAVDAMFPPGNRFQPQGVQLYAQPLPSGLTGPIKIEPRR